jgi:predicted metalloprotease
VQDSIESITTEVGVSDVEPMQRDGEVIEAGSPLVAYAALTFTLTGEDGEAVEGAVYVECRTLIGDEAVLEITHITAAEFFEEEHASVVTILRSLHMPSVSRTDEQQQPRRVSQDGNTPREDSDELVTSMEDSAESIDTFWAKTFDEIGLDYESPEVVFYDRPVNSGCGGAAPMEVGPHYCYVDSTIYIDTIFMEELILPYGEFALAFVIAHEWGHHLQNELDVSQCQIQQCLGGYTSLETELQADCIAGMWTRYADDAELLSYGDAESAVRVLAELVGDPEGTSVDDPAVHGPGSLRAYWFLRGYYEGAAACFDDGSD